MCLKIPGRVANSVDPDQTPRSAASDLGLHYLLRSVCHIRPNLNSSNTEGSFTMANSKLFLSPYEILPIA